MEGGAGTGGDEREVVSRLALLAMDEAKVDTDHAWVSDGTPRLATPDRVWKSVFGEGAASPPFLSPDAPSAKRRSSVGKAPRAAPGPPAADADPVAADADAERRRLATPARLCLSPLRAAAPGHRTPDKTLLAASNAGEYPPGYTPDRSILESEPQPPARDCARSCILQQLTRCACPCTDTTALASAAAPLSRSSADLFGGRQSASPEPAERLQGRRSASPQLGFPDRLSPRAARRPDRGQAPSPRHWYIRESGGMNQGNHVNYFEPPLIGVHQEKDRRAGKTILFGQVIESSAELAQRATDMARYKRQTERRLRAKAEARHAERRREERRKQDQRAAKALPHLVKRTPWAPDASRHFRPLMHGGGGTAAASPWAAHG